LQAPPATFFKDGNADCNGCNDAQNDPNPIHDLDVRSHVSHSSGVRTGASRFERGLPAFDRQPSALGAQIC
jgi:hypothetical protein